MTPVQNPPVPPPPQNPHYSTQKTTPTQLSSTNNPCTNPPCTITVAKTPHQHARHYAHRQHHSHQPYRQHHHYHQHQYIDQHPNARPNAAQHLHPTQVPYTLHLNHQSLSPPISPSTIFSRTLQDLQWLRLYEVLLPSIQQQPMEVNITWH